MTRAKMNGYNSPSPSEGGKLPKKFNDDNPYFWEVVIKNISETEVGIKQNQ